MREQLEDERQEIARLKKEKAELQSKLDEQKDLANSEASKLREDKIRLEGELKRREDEVERLKGEIKQLSKILPGGMITTFLRGLGMGRLFILGMGAVAAMAVLIWMFSSFHSLFQVTQSTNIDIIITAVEACGEMTTHRAYFETVADKKEDGWFGRWRRFVIIFGGTVDCGFDMRRAKVDIFDEDDKNEDGTKKRRIVVTLPHCRVLRTHVDLEKDEKTGKSSIRIYDQDGGWFSKTLTLEEQNEVVAEALEKLREKAVRDWQALQAAEKNAIELYQNFLRPFNCDVSVIFTNDPKKLAAPSGSNVRSSKSGGVLVVHTGQEEKQETEQKTK